MTTPLKKIKCHPCQSPIWFLIKINIQLYEVYYRYYINSNFFFIIIYYLIYRIPINIQFWAAYDFTWLRIDIRVILSRLRKLSFSFCNSPPPLVFRHPVRRFSGVIFPLTVIIEHHPFLATRLNRLENNNNIRYMDPCASNTVEIKSISVNPTPRRPI